MEKISAAYAMQWSIDLEKGLRSNKPGRAIEAIVKVGNRLEQWSKEPIHTINVLNMFGLVPGEDRLFANAILLRLADAFRYGDKDVRLCVLKVFRVEARNWSKGVMAKDRVPNYLELIRRVKIVYDKGDVESKALALRLFGCWADIAKDSGDVRYMILLSLRSSHVVEAKASIFAAGCLSELSEDFAMVFLEMLIYLMTSPGTLSTVKRMGVRAFAKMGCSSILAMRAYKIGKMLMMEYSLEFTVEMLISLSKVASKSRLVISEQVDFLISFMSQESTVCMKAMALRCLYFLSMKGILKYLLNADLISTLFRMVNCGELQPASQCAALRILCKIFCCSLPTLPYMEAPENKKLMSIVESAAQSPILSKRLLALRLLVDISLGLRMTGGKSPVDGTSQLPYQVVMLILDQITLLMKPPVLKPCRPHFEVKQECQSLINLVLCMVKKYPNLGYMALDRVRSLVESFVDLCEKDAGERKLDSYADPVATKLVCCMYRFVETCIEILDEASAVTTQIHHIVKLLVKNIHGSSLFSHETCFNYSILLHSHVNKNKESSNWIEHERVILEFTMKMMSNGDYWAAYRTGKRAMCQGSWFVASFTFRKLMNNVQSDACQYWLKSLSLFTQAESAILGLSFPTEGRRLVNNLQIQETWATCYDGALETCVADYSKKFNESYIDICSAIKMLVAAVSTDKTFFFQRWFLALRAKVLNAVVYIFTLLTSDQSNIENVGNGLSKISLRLKRLVQEFDLLATSFIGMDSKSFETISRLALECSILAFCTCFSLHFPHLHTNEILKHSHLILIQDLVERLRYIYDETRTALKRFVTFIGESDSCFHLPLRTRIYRSGCRERETLDVCKFAVCGILRMQEKAKGKEDDVFVSRESKDRLQLLSDILKKWMKLSFQVPKHFFTVRSCSGAELFAFNADTTNGNELSVKPGFHLSLNLCVQLINPPVRLRKLHCILSAKPSTETPETWDPEEAVDLYEKLMLHVSQDVNSSSRKHRRVCGGGYGSVWSFVCFNINETGHQGFSTCLLDVSAFPVGSYKMKWQGCSTVTEGGSYWSPVPLNMGIVFSVKVPPIVSS